MQEPGSRPKSSYVATLLREDFETACVLFPPCSALGMCDTPSSKLKNIPYRLGLQSFAMQKPIVSGPKLPNMRVELALVRRRWGLSWETCQDLMPVVISWVGFLWGRKIDHVLPHKNCHISTHPQWLLFAGTRIKTKIFIYFNTLTWRFWNYMCSISPLRCFRNVWHPKLKTQKHPLQVGPSNFLAKHWWRKVMKSHNKIQGDPPGIQRWIKRICLLSTSVGVNARCILITMFFFKSSDHQRPMSQPLPMTLDDGTGSAIFPTFSCLLKLRKCVWLWLEWVFKYWKNLALRFGMPPSSLHIHYVEPFKCEDFWLDPRFLVLEVVWFISCLLNLLASIVGCGRCVPFLGLILAHIKLFTRMGVWGSSLQETKKLFVGYKLLKKQNKIGLYLIFLQTKIRTVHYQQSHQIAQDKTFVKVWGKVDTVASKHAKQPHPRHPLKSSKHHPSQCPSPHSQPASVCSRINMHNQQCLIHLSYEHWEVKNPDEQADRVDAGMGGFWCIVSLIYIYIYLPWVPTLSL